VPLYQRDTIRLGRGHAIYLASKTIFTMKSWADEATQNLKQGGRRVWQSLPNGLERITTPHVLQVYRSVVKLCRSAIKNNPWNSKQLTPLTAREKAILRNSTNPSSAHVGLQEKACNILQITSQLHTVYEICPSECYATLRNCQAWKQWWTEPHFSFYEPQIRSNFKPQWVRDQGGASVEIGVNEVDSHSSSNG
jgi:DNA-binding CsgD family transcriptional regulator